MLSKKHYKAIAEIIQTITAIPEGVIDQQELVERLAGYFTADNPRFDAERFITACARRAYGSI